MIFAIYFLIAFCVWLLFTTDSRCTKKIKKEAKVKGLKIQTIRSSVPKDGENPFSKITFTIGIRTSILGLAGEINLDKIVTSEEHGTYWVRVKTLCFIPYKTIWQKKELQVK